MPLFKQGMVEEAEKVSLYDSIDAEVMQSYNEFQFTSLIYYTLKEAACSEQSSRMTAMDAASKNAGEFVFAFSYVPSFEKVKGAYCYCFVHPFVHLFVTLYFVY